MQLIFLLLCLFAIACVFYGISAGVQIIQRCATWLTGSDRAPSANASRAEQAQQTTSSISAPSRTQRCLQELQGLYRLYQDGALSQHEFEQLKQYLLSTIAPSVAQATPKNP